MTQPAFLRTEAKSQHTRINYFFMWIRRIFTPPVQCNLHQEKMEIINCSAITNLLSPSLARTKVLGLRLVNRVWSDNKTSPWQPSGFTVVPLAPENRTSKLMAWRPWQRHESLKDNLMCRGSCVRELLCLSYIHYEVKRPEASVGKR